MYQFYNGLVGMKWGAIGQVVLDLLNKLLYRIELTARYKYPIADGSVALDMISLSSNVAKVLAAGPAALMLKNGQGYKKKPKALMDKMLELESVITQLQLKEGWKQAKQEKFPFPAHHALELKKTTTEPIPPKVSTDEQYNPNLTSGSEADDEIGDFVKRAKEMKKSTAKSTAKSSSGSGFIKGQTLKPINEKYVIGKSATLPFNDLENDSFLVKPRSYEPVI
jgi:hypothetical protein